MTHGWWSISDTPSIDKLLRSFCLRGYREKSLFKALQKSKETFPRIFDPSNLKDCEVAFHSLLSHLGTNCVKSVSNSQRGNDSEATSSAGDGATNMDIEKTDGKSAAEKEEEGERKEADVDTSSGLEDMQIDLDPHRSDADKRPSSPALGEEVENNNGESTREKDNDSASDDSSDSDSSSSSSSSSTAHHSSQEEEGDESKDKAVPEKKQRLSSSGIMCSQLAVSTKPIHKIPPSGVFDPVFTELADQLALKVLEYVEGTEDRLFVAKLHEEVRIISNIMSTTSDNDLYHSPLKLMMYTYTLVRILWFTDTM